MIDEKNDLNSSNGSGEHASLIDPTATSATALNTVPAPEPCICGCPKFVPPRQMDADGRPIGRPPKYATRYCGQRVSKARKLGWKESSDKTPTAFLMLHKLGGESSQRAKVADGDDEDSSNSSDTQLINPRICKYVGDEPCGRPAEWCCAKHAREGERIALNKIPAKKKKGK